MAEQKQCAEAIVKFETAISINPKDHRYYDHLAFCLSQVGRYDEAIETAHRAISVDTKDDYAYRELGIGYCHKHQFEDALKAFEQAVSLRPLDAANQRWLGYGLYRLGRYEAATIVLNKALELRPGDFDAHYWRGLSLLRSRRFDEAAQALGRAAEIRPGNFEANLWRGMSFVRARKFPEAISCLEKAHEIKPQDNVARIELFACYLATQQFQRARRVIPFASEILAGAVGFVYLAGLALVLPFSLPIRGRAFPSLRLSFAWLVILIAGQVAFLLSFGLFRPMNESLFASLILAGLPLIVAAAAGFARQPWGGPFRWPLRLGSWKTVATSISLLLLLFFISGAFSALYFQATHKPPPMQRVIPLMQKALRTNPLITWVAVTLAIPVVEEILFRGLFYGAFEKHWQVTGAILGSAFIFACVHLELVGFFYLFCFAVLLAWARWRCGSLGLPMALHAFNNTVVLLALTFLRPG